MEWLLNNIFQILSLCLVPVITWFFTKRHFQDRDLKDRDVSTESNQSEIVSKNLDLYQRMLDDIEKRYEERLFKSDREKQELENIIIELKQIIKELEQALKESDELNHQLEIKTKKFVNEIINLKARLKNQEEK